jgi:hypothetical protein
VVSWLAVGHLRLGAVCWEAGARWQLAAHDATWLTWCADMLSGAVVRPGQHDGHVAEAAARGPSPDALMPGG